MMDNVIDMVLDAYGSMSAEELSALTHTETPWLEARGDLPEDAECREEIDRETMTRFYRRNRRLAGRTAADLAVGGIHLGWDRGVNRCVDVDALLSQIDEDPHTSDPWGGANLHTGPSVTGKTEG